MIRRDRPESTNLPLPHHAERLGLCLVGPGGIAAAHMRALRVIDRCDNRAVVGLTMDDATRFAAEWGFQHAHADLEQAVSDDAVDVVLIASPNQLHAPQATIALEAGKHVIVEIPAAMSLLDAERLAKLARERDRRALVCHTLRSSSTARWIRERVQSGSISVSQVVGLSATPRRHNEHWAGGRREWIDSLLWHHACHFVDLSMWILGSKAPTDLTAHFGRDNPEFHMTMDLSLSFVSENGCLVTQTLTYNTPTDVSEQLFITDHDLYVRRDSGLFTAQGDEIIAPQDWADLSIQDGEMLAAIIDGEDCVYTIDSVLPAMRVLEEMQSKHARVPAEHEVSRLAHG
jgi:2-hydroxy-4-carboxymuconate semialdehyde hemiacetal dehydrogenase